MKTTANDLFIRALELPEAKRDAFLHQACGGDAELYLEVLRLLVDAARADARFDRTDGETRVGVPRVGDPSVDSEKEGDEIGPYKLRQQIGEGGFGTVWMAEQRIPISRMVALKVVKAGMDTKQVLARFEAERQALAMMDHPHIARVLDAGATDKGRPFFVMELVKGIPITDYCDEAGLGTKDRLALFRDVCAAINHAHQKGIIHRDIKPSNVMITLYADKPVVKVIDFGIAKATQGKLTDQTLFTRFEQFIGTPVYMSPEQAALSAVDIDTRSDIYALGILLYELLTGKPPFDAKSLLSAGYEEMRRIIREVEPPKPSSRVSTMAGEERAALAKARHLDPDKLNRLVEPELDWIVMKAIDKDRTRRYDTANGLALDIQRHLKNEVVTARPPTAGYLFGKLIRRHRFAFATAAAVAVALVLGIVGTTFGLLRAEKQRRAAEQSQQLAEHRFRIARKFVDDMMQNVAPEFSNLIGASKANEAFMKTSLDFVESLGNAGSSDDEFQAYLSDLYGKASRSLGDRFDANSLGDTEAALSYATKALEIAENLLKKDPADPARQFRVLYFEGLVGTDLGMLNRAEESLPHLQRAVEMAEELAKSEPDQARWRSNVTFAHYHLGNALRHLEKTQEALEKHYLPYGRDLRELPVLVPATFKEAHMCYVAQVQVGSSLLQLGRAGEALPYLEKALQWVEIKRKMQPNDARAARDYGSELHDIGKAQLELGQTEAGARKLDEAVQWMKDLVARDPANGPAQLELIDDLEAQADGFAAQAKLPGKSPDQQTELWQNAIQGFNECQQRLDLPLIQNNKLLRKGWSEEIAQSRKEAELALSKLSAHE